MKEQYINAIQNVGAVLFIFGFTGHLMVDSLVAYIPCVVLESVGIALIIAAEYIVRKKEQKNKGQHRQAHDL